MPLGISILGITGKMGNRILLAASKDPELVLVGGSTHKNSPLAGTALLNITIESEIERVLSPCQVALDFSVREATLQHVYAAKEAKKALVIGTTGHSKEELHLIEKAAQEIPIVLSPNFSIGIALCLEMVSSLAQKLFGKCHIDIVEEHHIHKKDAPSGTALAFANAAGIDKTAIHSIRRGETIGEHQIHFECGHERIEIKHIAHSRDAFALGALLAAKRIAHKPPGLYQLKDLFP